MRPVPSWIILKFGGTSVSSLVNWRNIARVVAERRAVGHHILVVHSALSGVTDHLEKLLSPAYAAQSESELEAIEARHRKLADELEIPVSAELLRQFAELRQIAAGVALVGEVSDRIRARVLASGELMVTELAVLYLRAQGL